MITGLGSVSILTNDTKKFVERYRDKLGFEIVFQEGHSVFVRRGIWNCYCICAENAKTGSKILLAGEPSSGLVVVKSFGERIIQRANSYPQAIQKK